MDRLRIYVDTSVLGGCFDPEFVTWSEALIRDFRAKRLIPVLSDVTAAEIAAAPEAVRLLYREMLEFSGSVLPVTNEVLALVAAYEAREILPTRFAADMTPHCHCDRRGGRRSGELEFQAHCPSREDSLVQCERRIGVPGIEHPLASGGHHL
jgi:hypothetical protein